jgi:hypothetical protein
MRGSKSATGIFGLGWQQGRVLVTGRASGGGWYRQRRDAFDDQNGQIEHAEPNRNHEQPAIHLPGNPVEAKQALSHRDLTRMKMDQIMLRRSIKPRTLLQTFYEILPSREGSGSRSKRRCKPG